MPREASRGSKGSNAASEDGTIRIGRRRCPSKDGPVFETDVKGVGIASNLVAAGRAAVQDFRSDLRSSADLVRDAAQRWADNAQCDPGCLKRGSIVGPVDWDFPDVKEDLSKSPKRFTVTIRSVVRCSATILCDSGP